MSDAETYTPTSSTCRITYRANIPTCQWSNGLPSFRPLRHLPDIPRPSSRRRITPKKWADCADRPIGIRLLLRQRDGPNVLDLTETSGPFVTRGTSLAIDLRIPLREQRLHAVIGQRVNNLLAIRVRSPRGAPAFMLRSWCEVAPCVDPAACAISATHLAPSTREYRILRRVGSAKILKRLARLKSDSSLGILKFIGCMS